jgi:hypothetical protein
MFPYQQPLCAMPSNANMQQQQPYHDAMQPYAMQPYDMQPCANMPHPQQYAMQPCANVMAQSQQYGVQQLYPTQPLPSATT